MSNIVTVRDPDVIAAEIKQIQKTVRKVAIWAGIEIGGKLMEAKSMVDHGQWSKWLEENVEYRQSTANYLMQLYQEYGSGQVDLFDTWTNSQTFEKLSYSQHIALLSLPFGERQAMAEKAEEEGLSTRQLQQAIRERDAAREELIDAQQELAAAAETAERIQAAAKEAERAMAQQTANAENAAAAQKRAEESEKTALDLVEKLRKELSEKEALLKNPKIPEDQLAQLRQEAEQAAAKAEAERTRKKLEKAETKAKEAQAAREAAEAAAQAARDQLEVSQKQQKLQDPALVEFNALAKKWQQDFAAINTIRVKLLGSAPETAAKMGKMLSAILSNMQGILEAE